MASDFISKLLAPRSTNDWLDRRAELEKDERKARIAAEVQDWLNKNHPPRARRAR